MADKEKDIFWNADAIAEYERALAFIDRVRGMTGPGVTVSPFGITMGLPQRRADRQIAKPDETVGVQITDTEDGGGKYEAKTIRGDVSPADGTGTLVAPGDGQTANATPDALVYNLTENGQTTHVIPVGTVLYGVIRGYTTETTPRVVVEVTYVAPPQLGTLFAVNVTQDGGGEGDAATSPDWTYTVTGLDSAALAAGASPAWGRASGPMNAATHGTGYFNAAAEFVLWQVDEVEQTEPCEGA